MRRRRLNPSPRSFPTLAVLRLRNRYLTADEEFTKLRLLDTRIAIYQHTQRLLTLKAWLVTVASCALVSSLCSQ